MKMIWNLILLKIGGVEPSLEIDVEHILFGSNRWFVAQRYCAVIIFEQGYIIGNSYCRPSPENWRVPVQKPSKIFQAVGDNA